MIKDIKGGSQSGDNSLYNKVGRIEGKVDTIEKAVGKIWEKIDLNPDKIKEAINEHGLECPLKKKLSDLEIEKGEHTSAFRWYIGIAIAITGIIVSAVAAKLIIFH